MPNANQPELFPSAPNLPAGLVYRADFVTAAEEQALVREIERLDLGKVEMRGVVARRRTAHFGWNYHYETFELSYGKPIPDFLLGLRERLSELTAVRPDEFGEALVTEYPPGAPIGWHRDAPAFGIVVGISLVSECRMRFRPWPHVPARRGQAKQSQAPLPEQTLAPRSAYVLQGDARTRWEHSIPPVAARRYSITYRTLRARSVKRV